MKRLSYFLSAGMISLALHSCNSSGNQQPAAATEAAPVQAGQSAVHDDESQKDVVKVAIGSPDHTTLVAAVQAAELVDVLSNAGPFTVFAPVNAAFDALPAGTVEDLLKPENKVKLQNILQHHVYVGVLKTDMLRDGQILGMVDGTNATIHLKEGKVFLDGAQIMASVPASNGLVQVVNQVVLPK